MIRVLSVNRVRHAVRDRAACLAFYQRVFGARVFFQGRIEAEGRDATLLQIADFCIEVVSGEDPGAAAFLAEEGDRLFAICLRVEDLDAAIAHLEPLGVRLVRGPGRVAVTDPETTLGVRYEIVDRDLPDDPRLAPGFSTESWAAEPLTLESFWAVTTVVAKTQPALDFYRRAFNAEHLYTAEGPPARAASQFTTMVGMGLGIISILEPPTDRATDLTRYVDRLGMGGIHALSVRLRDPAAGRKRLLGLGIGLIGNQNYQMPHPRVCFGARFMMSRGVGPGLQFQALREAYLERQRQAAR